MFGMSSSNRLNPPPSDIWFQKQRSYFNSLDSDNNGYLTARDKDVLVRDFDSHRHGKNFKGRFHKIMDDIWSFLAMAPKITYQTFLDQRLALLKKARSSPDSVKGERFGYYKLIFDLTDVNEDHFWDDEEGVMHFHVFCRERVDEKEALRLLKLLDSSKNGKVSVNEFEMACFEFEFDEKPGKYDLLFGPLPPVKDAKPKGY